ncbi:MAG: glycoside hydrolase family 127 protein [Anaerolineae bacterium]|nr:glycoside hydrolase family 127 protein [Anaerolineae bacterium]
MAHSGVSLEGSHFFYENPLASLGHHHRTPWFLCPCCPPNVARTIASVGSHFYSTGPKDVWVHLYGQNQAEFQISDFRFQINQVTHYPWDGKVRFELGMAKPHKFALHLRVPGWCNRFTCKVNGSVIKATPKNGYLAINRAWKNGDVVEFTMAMPVQAVYAHPSVRQLQGRVALQRGPLVYCLEGADHDGAELERIAIDPRTLGQFAIEYRPDLLGGVTVLRGPGQIYTDGGWEGLLYRNNKPSASKRTKITAIPYYAWDNREAGEMRVWLRTS